MDALARALAGVPPPGFETVEGFWAWLVQESRALALPMDRAILGGAAADRLGFAFAAGYASALHALDPGLPRDELASLAATEEGGAHPRAIRTTLTERDGGLVLRGHKRWTTLAGRKLLVLSRAGEDEGGRPRLVVVRVSRDTPGVVVLPQPPLPFVPEIPHAELRFDDVAVAPADVLPGDGWDRWVKPFRTVEDLHVHAAALGYLLSLGARAEFPAPLRERMAAVLVGLRALAGEDPSMATVHVALAGLIAETRGLIDALAPHFERVPADERERWMRDGALLLVAEKARTARTAKAWERLRGGRVP